MILHLPSLALAAGMKLLHAVCGSSLAPNVKRFPLQLAEAHNQAGRKKLSVRLSLLALSRTPNAPTETEIFSD